MVSGATLIIPEDRWIGANQELIGEIGRNRISVLNLPTSYWAEWTNYLHLTNVSIPDCLRLVVVGGERTSRDTLERWVSAAPLDRIEWINTYGPTEASVSATSYRPGPGDPAQWASRVPIGTPIENCFAYVLDDELEPAPTGVIGELFLSGAGVARGYVNRPGLTAERFLPDPYEAGERMYGTGDLARRRVDGTLDFIDRADRQVKIRGFRVELEEIEIALRSHPGVREAVATVAQHGAGPQRLFAHVLRTSEAVSGTELRRFLLERLPEYMIPQQVEFISELPVLPTGKIDRARLPTPVKAVDGSEHVSPRTPLEETLLPLWEAILERRGLGVFDDFFELGGHSLMAMRLASAVQNTLRVSVPLRVLFERSTVAALAEYVAESGRDGHGAPGSRQISRQPHGNGGPLSFAEEGLWFLEQLGISGYAYNMPFAYHITDAVDREALALSIAEIVRRHETLRTRFEGTATGPARVVDEQASVWRVMDLSAVADPKRDALLRDAIQAGVERHFDLADGPPFQASLICLAPKEFVLLILMHHIVSDGWSIEVFMRELNSLYTAFSQGCRSPLAELPVQYADYAIWQRRRLTKEVIDSELQYWRTKLKGAPTEFALPADRRRPATASFRGNLLSCQLGQELSQAVGAASRRLGVTPFMMFLAVFKLVLWRWSGQSDIVVGTPVSGRTTPGTEQLIGLFVNTVLLRTILSKDASFLQLLQSVKNTVLEAHNHQDLPFEKLVANLQPVRDLSRQPLFQVLVSMDNEALREVRLGPITMTVMPHKWRTSKVDLSFIIQQDKDEFDCVFEYATDLFERRTIERLSRHFFTALRRVVHDSEVLIRDVSLLSEEERLHRPVTRRESLVPREPDVGCLHDLFREQVKRSPDACAIVSGGRQMSYLGLDKLSDRLAIRLVALGVTQETLVAVCLERSVDLIVAILSVLKAGGAYLPLDPTHPPDRLGSIIEDAAPGLLLTAPETARRLPSLAARTVLFDSEHEGEPETVLPPSGTTGDNAAYCIYTSGSTGRPKGVVVAHKNVVHLLSSAMRQFEFSPTDVWTMFHSIAFDFSVWELFGALLTGGKLVIVDHLVSRSPEEFLELLIRERVTVLNQTPSAFRQLMQCVMRRSAEAKQAVLRYVIFGGEALDIQSLKGWFELFPATAPRLVNMYGITETTVHVTHRAIGRTDISGGVRSPIGQALEHLEVFILDENLIPVPEGVIGEIYVAGAGLARGYLGRAGLTAERFIPSPLDTGPGSRLYRTGDLARMRAEGEVEYIGRDDRQIKLRGFRIELGEVEHCLTSHPDVTEAVAAVVERNDARRLVAWIVVAAEHQLRQGGVREYLQGKLPAHMIPARIIPIAALPLTGNGKLDREALESMLDASETDQLEYVAPATPEEKALSELWQKILDIPRIGRHDNFFALGGDSIMAVRVAQEGRVLGWNIRTADVFRYQTIAEFGTAIRTTQAGLAAMGSALLSKARAAWALKFGMREGALRYPLSSMQELMVREHARLENAGTGVYHVQQQVRFRDATPSIEAMNGALAGMMRAHPILRTRICCDESGFSQFIAARDSVPLREIALDGMSDAERAAAIETDISRDLAEPFNIDDHSVPLCRFIWLKMARDEVVFFMSIHHAIDDGWGNQLFLGELFDAYISLKHGKVPEFPAEKGVYAELVALEEAEGEEAASKAYWQRRADVLGKGGGAIIRTNGHSFAGAERVLGSKLLAGLREYCRCHRIALKVALLAAFATALDDTLPALARRIGVVMNGRSARLSDPLRGLGLYWSMVPLDRQRTPDSFTERVLSLHETLAEFEQHANYPLREIAVAYGLDMSVLFGSTFNFVEFHNAPKWGEMNELSFMGTRGLDRFHYPLNLHCSIDRALERIELYVEFSAAATTRQHAQKLLDRIAAILESSAVEPSGTDVVRSNLEK